MSSNCLLVTTISPRQVFAARLKQNVTYTEYVLIHWGRETIQLSEMLAVDNGWQAASKPILAHRLVNTNFRPMFLVTFQTSNYTTTPRLLTWKEHWKRYGCLQLTLLLTSGKNDTCMTLSRVYVFLQKNEKFLKQNHTRKPYIRLFSVNGTHHIEGPRTSSTDSSNFIHWINSPISIYSLKHFNWRGII